MFMLEIHHQNRFLSVAGMDGLILHRQICLKHPSEIVVWILDTFHYNFGIENNFTKYLKKSC